MPRPEYGVGTPGNSRAGRMLAYVSNSFRRVTLALFSPKPIGVSSGPFKTTRVWLIESIVSCGTPEGSPCLNTSAPAWRSCHSIGAPLASTIRCAAPTTSRPMPSPGIRVTGVAIGRNPIAPLTPRQQQTDPTRPARLCFNPGVTDASRVVRSTILLAGTLACLSGMVQLVVAMGTVTVVLATGVEGVLGLGPAVFLMSGALAAFPAGRAMDRHGRVPVLAAGCTSGIAGCCLCALGASIESSLPVLVGFVLIGVSSGTVLLARAAAADLYPPRRRALGISRVLFGSLFGAALGPLVFGPLLSGREIDLASLVLPYLAAAGLMAVGLVLVLLVRPEPKLVAERYRDPGDHPVAAAPLSDILARPRAGAAALAAVASCAVLRSWLSP